MRRYGDTCRHGRVSFNAGRVLLDKDMSPANLEVDRFVSDYCPEFLARGARLGDSFLCEGVLIIFAARSSEDW